MDKMTESDNAEFAAFSILLNMLVLYSGLFVGADTCERKRYSR